MACWIFQGNPDDYDLDEYFRTQSYVYWWTRHGKHQREMRTGDQVFFWRAAGNKTKAVAGIVGYGQVAEEPVVRRSVLHTKFLRDDLWHGIKPDPSGFVAGIVLSDVRLTQRDGMLTRHAVAIHPTLGELGVIKVGTGTNFRLEPEHTTALIELWGAGASPAHRTGPLGSPEGRIMYKIHKERERDPALARRKKSDYKTERGFLACEICEWKGEDQYGALGEDLVEVHHLRPISDMKPGERTRLEDLMLVCPNCHRAVHRGDPDDNLKTLKALFST